MPERSLDILAGLANQQNAATQPPTTAAGFMTHQVAAAGHLPDCFPAGRDPDTLFQSLVWLKLGHCRSYSKEGRAMEFTCKCPHKQVVGPRKNMQGVTIFGGDRGGTVWRRVGWLVTGGKRRRDDRPWLLGRDVTPLLQTTACPRRDGLSTDEDWFGRGQTVPPRITCVSAQLAPFQRLRSATRNSHTQHTGCMTVFADATGPLLALRVRIWPPILSGTLRKTAGDALSENARDRTLSVRRKSHVASGLRARRGMKTAFHGRHGGRPLQSVVGADFCSGQTDIQVSN